MKTLVSRMTGALVLVMSLGTVAAAQVAPPQIAARQDLMKANSAAVRVLVRMAQGVQPWSRNAAREAAATITKNAQQIVSLFPPGSGAASGVETAARPEIWENMADFAARARALQDVSAKLTDADEPAALKAQLVDVAKTCSGCHEAYRSRPE